MAKNAESKKKASSSRQRANLKAKAQPQRTLLDHFAGAGRRAAVLESSQNESATDVDTDVDGREGARCAPASADADVRSLSGGDGESSQGRRTKNTAAPGQPSSPLPENMEIEVIDISSDTRDYTSVSVHSDDDDVCALDGPGSTRHAPIVVPDSPAAPARQPLRAPHPLFTSQKVAAAGAVRRPAAGKAGGGRLAPFPDRESQHVRGAQGSYVSPALGFGRRQRTASPRSDAGKDAEAVCWKRGVDCSAPPPSQPDPSYSSAPDREACLVSIPRSHIRVHPAIQRLLECDPATRAEDAAPQQLLWAAKWRPVRAEEVLGNEGRAVYLRDWLRALALQVYGPASAAAGAAGRAGKRGAGRGVKRPAIIRAVGKGRKRRRRRADSDEEEEWIVDDEEEEDEPPDLGESDEDELSALGVRPPPVDDHSDGGTPPPAFPSAAATLRNTVVLAGPPGCGKSAAVYACAAELGWRVFEVYPGVGRRGGGRLEELVGEVGRSHVVGRGRGEDLDVIEQSLILLEEVDIVFKDDINFWPSIVEFIGTCKRPVILTCNDLSLVPVDELPLQAILTFSPCSGPVGTSYLQALSLAEGHRVERGELGWVYGVDLRRAVHNLQFLCAGGVVGEERVVDEADEEWVVDGERVKRAVERTEGVGWGPSGDDEVGHVILWDEREDEEEEEEEECGRGKREYERSMLEVLAGVVRPLVPHSALFVEYLPAVRWMVDTDEAEGWKSVRRGTRNSQRSAYARQVMVSDEGRLLLKQYDYTFE